jgi:hypothetical protein
MRWPLYDTDRFTRHVESTYTAMAQRHRGGLPPGPISVPRLGQP